MEKILSWILLLILLVSVMPVFAEDGPVTHYELRTGVVFAWCNSSGVWQKGIEKDQKYNKSTTTIYDIGALYPKYTIENVTTYAYNPDSFDFSKLGDTWNKTQFASDKSTYDDFYYNCAATGITMSDSWNAKTSKLEYTYSGKLTAINGDPIDVKDYLKMDRINDIYAMMGYTAATAPADIKEAMDELYPKAGQSEKVEGYLYFVPIIIQYDVVPEPVAALLPPKPRIDCAATSAFIGRETRVKGSISNQNAFPVIMRYDLTVNGEPILSGSKEVAAKSSFTISKDFMIPAAVKPGKLYIFQITAKNIARAEGPPAHYKYSYGGVDHERIYTQEEWEALLNQQDSEVRREMQALVKVLTTEEWTRYMDTHVQDSVANAWYLKNGEWKTGVSNKCPRTAVPLPEAPLDHGLNPAVIVK